MFVTSAARVAPRIVSDPNLTKSDDLKVRSALAAMLHNKWKKLKITPWTWDLTTKNGKNHRIDDYVKMENC